MHCLQQETPLTLEEARKRCPTRPNLSTIWRWAIRGVRGVKLETYIFAGRRLTSVEALERFQDRTNRAGGGIPAKPLAAANRRQDQKQRAQAKARAKNLL
jgi:hypothetical protein